MTTPILLFIAGLVILIVGADLLVRGASRLAAAFGISPLVIGLTIVAIGTASPEIAVSLQAAVNGQGDLDFYRTVSGAGDRTILYGSHGIVGKTAPTGDAPEQRAGLCRAAKAVARGECQKAGLAEPGG